MSFEAQDRLINLKLCSFQSLTLVSSARAITKIVPNISGRRRMRLSFITDFAGRTLPATGRRLRLRSREGQLCGDEAAAGVSRCEREREVQRLQKGSQVPGHDAGPGDCGSEALHLRQDAVCVLLRVAAATTLGDGCTWEVRRAAEGATGGVHNPPSAYGTATMTESQNGLNELEHARKNRKEGEAGERKCAWQ